MDCGGSVECYLEGAHYLHLGVTLQSLLTSIYDDASDCRRPRAWRIYVAGPRVRRGVAAQRDVYFNLGALRFDYSMNISLFNFRKKCANSLLAETVSRLDGADQWDAPQKYSAYRCMLLAHTAKRDVHQSPEICGGGSIKSSTDAILPGNRQYLTKPASKLRCVMDHTRRRWLRLFVMVLSALTIGLNTAACAATIPSNQILGGMCQPSQGVASNSTALRFTKWTLPPWGYQISENPRVAMTYTQIYQTAGRPYARTEDVLAFLQDFHRELQEHYGSGSEILARKVGSKFPDVESACYWHIYFESRQFSKPMVMASVGHSPLILKVTGARADDGTKTALNILQFIRQDFISHGSAAIEVWIAQKVFDYGFAHLTFTFDRFDAAQEPGCSGNGTFYTCPSAGNTDASVQVTR